MVQDGNYVAVHYTGTFEDGEVFDTSLDREPLEFQVGAGSVIPGFEQAVRTMKIEEEKNVTLAPEEAYGQYDDSLVHSFPVADIKKQIEPETGMSIWVQLENGAQVPGLVTEVNHESVTLDLNHPLAGKTLHFMLRLVEINDAPKYSHGCDGNSCGHDCSC